MNEVKAITWVEMNSLLSTNDYKNVPYKRYISECNGEFVGLDNSTGNGWVETFVSYTACLLWVGGCNHDKIF